MVQERPLVLLPFGLSNMLRDALLKGIEASIAFDVLFHVHQGFDMRFKLVQAGHLRLVAFAALVARAMEFKMHKQVKLLQNLGSPRLLRQCFTLASNHAMPEQSGI